MISLTAVIFIRPQKTITTAFEGMEMFFTCKCYYVAPLNYLGVVGRRILESVRRPNMGFFSSCVHLVYLLRKSA